MIIPEYWAEGRVQDRQQGHQITVRRFGWSDISQADAQAHADRRAHEALERIQSGEKLVRREPKRAYNGAEGVPIREEILSRHGDTIITRNTYGARCLNTPQTLFADIDFENRSTLRTSVLVFSVLFVCAAAASWMSQSWTLGLVLVLLAALLSYPLAAVLDRLIQKISGGADRMSLRLLEQFISRHPAWNLRIYRTPAGLRVLATHQTFHPADTDASSFFSETGTDPLYVKMCKNQQCFRARVSPKPWRISIPSHMKPRPGVWPISPEQLPVRNRWVTQYEAVAQAYAACAYTHSLGSGFVHPDIQDVITLHDDLSGALSQRPIA
ncbi:MAG TPA: hypothetical protein VIN38_00735 [Thiobacillus sp.]